MPGQPTYWKRSAAVTGGRMWGRTLEIIYMKSIWCVERELRRINSGFLLKTRVLAVSRVRASSQNRLTHRPTSQAFNGRH